MAPMPEVRKKAIPSLRRKSPSLPSLRGTMLKRNSSPPADVYDDILALAHDIVSIILIYTEDEE